MFRRVLLVSIAAGVAALGVSGCGDDEVDPDRSPTFTVPSVATMSPDLAALQGKPQAEAGACHGLAALVVVWVNTNVAVRLAVPVLAFSAAVHETPVYLGDDTWRWTANGGVGEGAWTAELEASVNGDGDVAWTMRISGTAQEFNRFLWFSGTSDRTAHAGVWHYFDPRFPSQPQELVEAEWTYSDDQRSLTFRNVGEGAAESGDVLAYSLDGATASIEFFDAGESTMSAVTWNTDTGAGSMTNPQGETCCWGAGPGFTDVSCSP